MIRYFLLLLYLTNTETGKRTNYHFSDDKVCKSFLLECCPHEILAATVSIQII